MVRIDRMSVAIEASFAGKESETACQRRGIALFALPPKSPKHNGCVERANAAGPASSTSSAPAS